MSSLVKGYRNALTKSVTTISHIPSPTVIPVKKINSPSNNRPMSQNRAKWLRINTIKSSWILGFPASSPRICLAHRKTMAAGPVIIDTMVGGTKEMCSGGQDW